MARSRQTLFILAFFLAAFAVGSDSWASNPQCEAWYQNLSQEDVDLLIYRDAKAMNDGSIPPDLMAQKRDAVWQGLKAYQGKTFEELQDQSLLAALRLHGLRPDGKSGYATLREASRKNLERLIGKRRYQPKTEMKEAEELVDNIQLGYVHYNSDGRLHARPKTPILSSRQIKNLTGEGGLNSSHDFNSEFMRQDDQVFFFLYVDASSKKAGTEYGTNQFALNPDYAREKAWISAFVMYSNDLGRNGRHLRPETARKLSNSPAMESAGSVAHLQPQMASWTKLRNSLHKLDFTVGDFETLIHEQMLRSLEKLQKKDARAYEAALKTMRNKFLNKSDGSGDAAEEFDKLVNDLVFAPLDLPAFYELKVPVAVPENKFEFSR